LRGQEVMHFQDGTLRRIGVIFEPMPEQSPSIAQILEVLWPASNRQVRRSGYGWNGQLIGGDAAQGIISHGGLELQFVRDRK
jgi:hypothetical protein